MSEGIDNGEGRKEAAKLLGGRISCTVGNLFGAGGILLALLGASANVSAGAVGAVTIVLGVIAVIFMAAAAIGLIPGVEPLGHGYD